MRILDVNPLTINIVGVTMITDNCHRYKIGLVSSQKRKDGMRGSWWLKLKVCKM